MTGGSIDGLSSKQGLLLQLADIHWIALLPEGYLLV